MAILRPVPVEISPGQESVWSFPRPAIAEPSSLAIRVLFGGRVIAETTRSIRVLETSHPPSYYVPPDDVARAFLRPADGSSLCEWKGGARYFDVVAGDDVAAGAAWSYRNPTPSFRAIRDHVAFYPALVECWVEGERALPQDGGFYGGWITSHVAGPFKGPPGTAMW